MLSSRLPVAVSLLLLVSGVTLAGEAIPNWPAPAFWHSPASHASADHARAVQAAITSPLPFVPITPCRMLDTRASGGPIASGSTRNATLTGSPCGIPSNAAAVSANFAVFNITGTSSVGVLLVYPTGSASSSQAIVNWSPTSGQIDNASVVPLGNGGAITVQPNQGAGTIDLVIDVNGYYAAAGTGSFNTFLGSAAGNFTMTGDFNTALGSQALGSNTAGTNNTALGAIALALNTNGFSNTAVGRDALYNNISGSGNTAVGHDALHVNQSDFNTAVGLGALFSNIGSGNTATGTGALSHNTTGSDNIAIGFNAGTFLTTGSSNICIGNLGNSGVASESSTIRIGAAQTATFIAGISGATSAGGVPVFVNPSGQLGTTTSSRRFKEDIREIGDESDGLLRLRPVTFKYRREIDPTGLAQYGLIAEEVAEVYPDLVAFDREGRPETVRYHLISALLLNEVQKQRRTIEALEDRLAKVEVRLLVGSSP